MNIDGQNGSGARPEFLGGPLIDPGTAKKTAANLDKFHDKYGNKDPQGDSDSSNGKIDKDVALEMLSSIGAVMMLPALMRVVRNLRESLKEE